MTKPLTYRESTRRFASKSWLHGAGAFGASVLLGAGWLQAAQPYCPPCQNACPPSAPAFPSPLTLPTPDSSLPSSAAPSLNNVDPASPLSQPNAQQMNVPQSNPGSPQPQQQNFAQPNLSTNLAQGAASANSRSTPGMIGDFFGGATGGGNLCYLGGIPLSSTDPVNSPGSAGGGRLKIQEQTSPLPRDRVFFGYSHFDNVALNQGGVAVNRYTPGFEKTFLDGNASIEVRLPFSSTLDDSLTSGVQGSTSTQFGNATLYLKALAAQTCEWAVSYGLGISIPTAPDTRLFDGGGSLICSVENEAVRLLPFFGTVYTPNDKFFVQQFLQLDIDANGNTVYDGSGNQIGVLQDTNFIYYSVSAGYWVYQNNCCDAWLTGLAPIVELHYNRSLGDTDSGVGNGSVSIGNLDGSDTFRTVSVLNATLGMTGKLGQNKTLTAGYVLPLGGGNDQQFDGEFRLVFNWFFGGTGGGNRFRSIQF